MKIVRRNGRTYWPKDAPAELSEVLETWGWILPWNGEFQLPELHETVMRGYDMENPKTAHDLAVMRRNGG